MNKKINIEIFVTDTNQIEKVNASFSLSSLAVNIINKLSFNTKLSRSAIIENLILKEVGINNNLYKLKFNKDDKTISGK